MEAALGGLAGYTDPNDQINAVNQVVDGGAVSPELLARVAGSQGVAPDAVAGQVESIRAGFEAQARSTVAAMGLDPEAVFTHAWEVDPEGMEKAQRDHATQRSTEGYKALARSYVENLDTLDPQAVLNAEFGNGVTAYQHGDKIILQDHLGRTFEWKAAVRAGIVSVGR